MTEDPAGSGEAVKPNLADSKRNALRKNSC